MDNQRTKEREGVRMIEQKRFAHTKLLKAIKAGNTCKIKDKVDYTEYYEIREKVKQLTNARLYVTEVEPERISLLLEIKELC